MSFHASFAEHHHRDPTAFPLTCPLRPFPEGKMFLGDGSNYYLTFDLQFAIINVRLYPISKIPMKKSIENLPADNINQRHRTIQMSVADRLRSFILTNQLSPGERLIQDELAKKLGVSRTPIREALNILASEGLVTVSPYKGATVTRLSLSDLEELYCVRFALESHACYLAAINISDEEIEQLEGILQDMAVAAEQSNVSALMELNFLFNKTIYAASRSSLLCEQAVMFMRAADKYRRIHFSVQKLTLDAIAEHWELLDALKNHEPKAVDEITRNQNQRSISAMKQLIQGHVE